VIHQKPIDSRDHQILYSTLEEQGVDHESLLGLLWCINAPDQLISFARIAKNIGEMLNLAENIISFDLETVQMQEWPTICEAISLCKEGLTKKIGVDFSRPAKWIKGKEHHPLRGSGFVRHALYSSLWNKHEEDEQTDRYHLLQAHILIAHAKLMQEETTCDLYMHYSETEPILGKLNGSLYRACGTLKDVSFSRNMDVLEALPLENSHMDFCNYLMDFRSTASGSPTKLVNAMALFFRHVYRKEAAEERKHGSGHKRYTSKKTMHDGYIDLSPTMAKQKTSLMDADDPDSQPGTQLRIIERTDNELWEDVDLDPSENETGSEIYLTEYPETGNVKSILGQYMAAHSQIRQLSMANQLMRNQWHQLTIYEVAQLMRLCGDCYRAIDRQNKSEQDELTVEIVALIMTMLWTGSTVERATKLSFIEESEGLNASELAYIAEKKEWRLKPFLPEYQTTPTPEQTSLSKERSKYVYLPDTFNVGGYIEHVARQSQEKNKKKVFWRRSDTYRKYIRSFLKHVPEGCRVTESKISRYLFHLIASEISGDVADAILTTAQYHPLGQTLLHYTTPTADHIRDIYIQAIDSVVENIYQEAYEEPLVQPKAPKPLPGKHLGSRLCPKDECVRTLVSTLYCEITGGLPSRLLTEYIRYHNIYTIYTSLMLGYATGFRAIKDPYIHPDEVDSETGLVIVSDKDGEDYYNARPIWIPDTVLQQLRFYEEHKNLVESDVRVRMYNSGKPRQVFLLNKNLSMISLRPKYITPYLESIFPLPLNVNRRYLRTELKETGCPIEVINCFMGHWSRGEEPWGKFSSFSFQEYVTTIRQYIPSILEHLNWRPIESHIY